MSESQPESADVRMASGVLDLPEAQAEDPPEVRAALAGDELAELGVKTDAAAAGVGYGPGDRIGPFELGNPLGSGGMATVFRARHSIINRLVAVKVLSPEAEENPNAVMRFFQEARAITALEHPNIVDITDVEEGTEDHPPYMVMELVDGVNLGTYVKDHGPMMPAQVLAIGEQICNAMIAVHAAGIVHRDLKPDNIILLEGEAKTQTPTIKLLDFGVAKFMVSSDNAFRTRTGAVVGTPEFMAPEQIRGRAVDIRSDVYAMGGLLFYLLTGRHVFVCKSVGEQIRKQLGEQPKAPSSVLEGRAAEAIPSALDTLVLRCLAKDADARPQTMRILERQLLRPSASETALVPQFDGDKLTGLGRRPGSEQARRRAQVRWGGLAAFVGLLVLGGAWMAAADLMDADLGNLATLERNYVTSAPVETPVLHRVPRQPVQLTSTPSGAAVFRAGDGSFLGRTPLPLPVPSLGDRVDYLVQLRGYHRERVMLRSNSAPKVTVTLKSKTPPRPMSPDAGVSPRLPPMTTMTPWTPMTGPTGHWVPPMRPPRPPPVMEWGVVDPFKQKR